MNNTKIEKVEEMPVFQRFYELAVEIERATRNFGPDFRWLRVQALRSSESVCANMAEGFYSQYSTEYVQALHRCRREGRETIVHLRYACDTGNLSVAHLGVLEEMGKDALQHLAAVITSIERKIGERSKGKPAAPPVRDDFGVYLPSMPHLP